MSNYLEYIRDFKKSSNPDVIEFEYDGVEVSLRVVDPSPETANLALRWRMENKNWFGTSFHGSLPETERWIRESILGNPDRMLLLIIYNGQKIGHIGFGWYDLTENSVLLSDVIRGESGIAPGLMTAVTKRLIAWIFDELQISTIKLNVFSDDARAIRLYERCGMKPIDVIPLKKQNNKRGFKWVPLYSDSPTEKAERYYSVMVIHHEK